VSRFACKAIGFGIKGNGRWNRRVRVQLGKDEKMNHTKEQEALRDAEKALREAERRLVMALMDYAANHCFVYAARVALAKENDNG